MAFVLTTFENENGLFNFGDMGGPWYGYLWEKMRARELAELGENCLTIITFNYDRSLEHYLHTVAGNSFGKSPDECTAVVSQIPIIHVHGRLGWLPWQCQGPAREYCSPPEDRWQELRECASLIKIVSEKTDFSQDEEFFRAREAISKAAKLCFLGFGYNRSNTERLELSATPPEAWVAGTAYGNTPKEKTSLEKMLEESLAINHRGVVLGGRNVEVLGHLRHTGMLD